MNAIFDETQGSYLQIRSKFMSQILQHFYRSFEVAITATVNSLTIRSFYAPEVLLQDHKHIMNTGLNVSIQELDHYDFRSQYTQEELIFGVKELTGFVGYCEAIEMNTFDFFFTSGGR